MEKETLAYARRRQIEEGLLEMLRHTPFQNITICDLCAKLNMTRKVFYKHYRDKEDCLKALTDHIIRESLVYTARNIPNWGMSLESAVVILGYWKENRTFLDIVTRDHLLELFVGRAMHISLMEEQVTVSQLLSRPDMPCDGDIVSAYLGFHFSLILQWHAREFDTPVEEMAKKYLRLVRFPLFAQM